MNKSSNIKVFYTDEYEKFKYADGNRSVTIPHVKQICKSIEEIGLIPNPVIVNQKMEVIDGQHRLEACKETGNPVYYIVIPDIGMKEAVAMNAYNKKWTSADYLEYWASTGNPDYVFIKAVNATSPIPLSTIIQIFSDSNQKQECGHAIRKFQKGDFKVGDIDMAKDTVDWLGQFAKPMSGIRGRKISVYLALKFIYQNMSVDTARMMSVITSMANEHIGVADLDAALQYIEERYNNHLAKKNRQYFCHAYEIR